MPQGHNRHPNKRVKVKEHAMRQAEKLKTTQLNDKPIALLDIGEAHISELIRSVTGQFEDAFQDAWVRVLEDHVSCEEDIIQIAKTINHEHASKTIGEHYKQIDLDKPIGQHADEGDFTLKDILESSTYKITDDIISNPDTYIDTSEKPNRRNRNGKAYLYKQGMDDDVVKLLNNKYPGESLREALRLALGLSRKSTYNWNPSEVATLRRRYENGNKLEAISIEIGRSIQSIRNKVCELNLKRDRIRTTPKSSFNKEDLLHIFKFGARHLNQVIANGKLSGKHYKNLVIFNHEDIVMFIRNHPFCYRHELLSLEWKRYIPPFVLEWQPIEQVANNLHWGQHKIRRMLKDYDLPIKYYGDGNGKCYSTYIRAEDLEHILQIDIIQQPYKVALMGEKTHYVDFDSEGDLYRVCAPYQKGLPGKAIIKYNINPYRKGFPTCLKCLEIYKKKTRIIAQ